MAKNSLHFQGKVACQNFDARGDTKYENKKEKKESLSRKWIPSAKTSLFWRECKAYCTWRFKVTALGWHLVQIPSGQGRWDVQPGLIRQEISFNAANFPLQVIGHQHLLDWFNEFWISSRKCWSRPKKLFKFFSFFLFFFYFFHFHFFHFFHFFFIFYSYFLCFILYFLRIFIFI